jgi:hypothetical protein
MCAAVLPYSGSHPAREAGDTSMNPQTLDSYVSGHSTRGEGSLAGLQAQGAALH